MDDGPGPTWGDDLFSDQAPMAALPIRAASSQPEYGASPPLHAQHVPENVRTGAQPMVQGGPPEAGTFAPPRPVHDVYHHRPMPAPSYGHAMPSMMFSQAVGSDPSGPAPKKLNTLGLSVVAVGGGVAAGAFATKSVAGAGAGALFGGAAVNAFRALAAYRQGTPESDREGRISLLFGAIAAVGGGYVWYRFVHKQRRGRGMTPNTAVDDDDDELDLGSCDIRPAGP